MTKGYPIFEWIPGIPIIEKNLQQHEDKHDDDITENGE